MLVSLVIHNVVLIDRLTVEFRAGLCALTGETGAGKSILLDSLGLALGARSEAGLVGRSGEQASVSAEFHVENDHPALAILKERELEASGSLVLRRTVGRDGRSRAFINDQPVGVALLKDVGALLVEIHGQFETHGLLDQKTHRALLDDYAGVQSGALQVLWRAWKDSERELQDAHGRAAKALQEEDYLRTSLEDLDALDPRAGDEARLTALRDRLMRRDQVLESFGAAHEGLGEAEESLNKIWRTLEKAGEEARPLLDGLDRAIAELREINAQVRSQSADLEEGEQDLASIDDRLFALRAQARKHSCGCEDLPRVREDLESRLALAERQEEVLDGLRARVAESRSAFVKECANVTAMRKKAAEKLSKLVAKELPPLKLDKAQFITEVTALPEESWGPAGADDVRFLVATNPGRPPGPLDKIASGGEMARFMLAIKVVMAETGAAGTLVFDEVDTGIGGATADAVGERLARLATGAKARQVLVVTHAPQVAARAASHWLVIKEGKTDVATKVVPLAAGRDRREEIARMLAGAEITDEARAAASRLLETGT